MEKDGPGYGLYGDHASWDRMMATMDAELRADKRLQATVPLLMAGRPGLDLRGYVQRKFSSPGAGAKLPVELDGGGSPGALVAKLGGRGRAAFAMAKGMPVCAGATYEGGRFALSALYPFIRALYPGLSPAFLSSADIRSALEKLGGAGRVEAIAYAPKPGGRKTGPGAGQAARRAWRPCREALAGGEPIGRIRFRLAEPGSAMEGQISRGGVLRFRGSFLPFGGAMRQLARAVSDRARLYSGRSRSENGGKMRPLVVEVAGSPFKDAAGRGRLISAVESVPRASSGLYSLGPCLHMFLVDFGDGSSFDIWAVSDGEVTIVPQIRATPAAVARLTFHITREFGEGRVREHELSEA